MYNILILLGYTKTQPAPTASCQVKNERFKKIQKLHAKPNRKLLGWRGKKPKKSHHHGNDRQVVSPIEKSWRNWEKKNFQRIDNVISEKLTKSTRDNNHKPKKIIINYKILTEFDLNFEIRSHARHRRTGSWWPQLVLISYKISAPVLTSEKDDYFRSGLGQSFTNTHERVRKIAFRRSFRGRNLVQKKQTRRIRWGGQVDALTKKRVHPAREYLSPCVKQRAWRTKTPKGSLMPQRAISYKVSHERGSTPNMGSTQQGGGWKSVEILDRDCALSSDIQQLVKMEKTMALHRRSILDWYDHPISSGPMEGTNNKIKTMKRQAYGFRDMEFFKLRIMRIHEAKYAITGWTKNTG